MVFLPASYQGIKIDGVQEGRNGGGRMANIGNPKLTAHLERNNWTYWPA